MLELRDVTKIFHQGTVNERIALDRFSLTLSEGDFVTVIGGNGAGKSTMLNVTAGVIPVDGGRVVIGGKDVTDLPEHRRAAYIGRVFQDPMRGTAADMWVEENLALAERRGRRRGLRWFITGSGRERYRAALAELGLGLESRLNVKMGLLSGGQRQAVTLLMASLGRPRLLLLDEHTAALDPKTAAVVLSLTDRIVRENGLTTLMVTHNMREAIAYGNRLIMMRNGRVALDVSGEEKRRQTVEGLIGIFAERAGEELAGDRLLLG